MWVELSRRARYPAEMESLRLRLLIINPSVSVATLRSQIAKLPGAVRSLVAKGCACGGCRLNRCSAGSRGKP